ncbi:unnamed protein product, partial [Mesorhabditis belari]|uniref:Uncharacterized protein n=1 Tax=Mesorhabditis belari TaxID=2138241 RepID=A0AAF3J9R3_9BILA
MRDFVLFFFIALIGLANGDEENEKLEFQFEKHPQPFIVKKDLKLLNENNGSIQLTFRANEGYNEDLGEYINKALRVKLEIEKEQSGKIYRDLAFTDWSETRQFEIIGNSSGKAHEFFYNSGILYFRYNETAPNFTLTVTEIPFLHGCECSGFSYEYPDGIRNPTQFPGAILTLDIPKNCTMIKCGWASESDMRMGQEIDFSFLGAYDKNDRFYIRNSNGTTSLLPESGSFKRFKMMINEPFEIYFISGPNPSRDRHMNFQSRRIGRMDQRMILGNGSGHDTHNSLDGVLESRELHYLQSQMQNAPFKLPTSNMDSAISSQASLAGYQNPIFDTPPSLYNSPQFNSVLNTPIVTSLQSNIAVACCVCSTECGRGHGFQLSTCNHIYCNNCISLTIGKHGRYCTLCFATNMALESAYMRQLPTHGGTEDLTSLFSSRLPLNDVLMSKPSSALLETTLANHAPFSQRFDSLNKEISNHHLFDVDPEPIRAPVFSPSKTAQKSRVCAGCHEGAAQYCENCQESLCDDCVSAHQRVRFTRDHHIVRLPERRECIKETAEESQPQFIAVKLIQPDGSPLDLAITERSVGGVSLNFVPKLKGVHNLYIQLQGSNTKGAPIQFEVLRGRNYKEVADRGELFHFGKEGSEDGELCRPWGICCDQKGRIIVADRSNNRIQIFDPEGKFLQKFGMGGNRPGQFDRPAGVCVNTHNQIIVADKDNHRVQVFDNDGNFVFKFGERGRSQGMFNYPWGVATNNLNEIAVSDTRNHRVQIFSSHGEFLLKCGFDTAYFYKHLDSPRGVCYLPNGQLLITDFNNHRVVLMGPKGGPDMKCYGSEGDQEGLFLRPQGIAIDMEGHILVCDSRNNRVQVFASDDMRCVTVFGGAKLALSPTTSHATKSPTQDINLLAMPMPPVTSMQGTPLSLDFTSPPPTNPSKGKPPMMQFGSNTTQSETAVGSSLALLDRPTDLCIGLDGRIYVVDFGNNCVRVF